MSINYRCPRCDEDVVEQMSYTYWLALMNFIGFLYSEQQITQATHDEMQTYALHLKPIDTKEVKEIDDHNGIVDDIIDTINNKILTDENMNGNLVHKLEEVVKNINYLRRS